MSNCLSLPFTLSTVSIYVLFSVLLSGAEAETKRVAPGPAPGPAPATLDADPGPGLHVVLNLVPGLRVIPDPSLHVVRNPVPNLRVLLNLDPVPSRALDPVPNPVRNLVRVRSPDRAVRKCVFHIKAFYIYSEQPNS